MEPLRIKKDTCGKWVASVVGVSGSTTCRVSGPSQEDGVGIGIGVRSEVGSSATDLGCHSSAAIIRVEGDGGVVGVEAGTSGCSSTKSSNYHVL